MSRNNYDILYEILVFCKEPKRTTEILGKCNIAGICFHRNYKKFLTVSHGLRRKTLYKTTLNGIEFIKAYQKLKAIYDSEI